MKNKNILFQTKLSALKPQYQHKFYEQQSDFFKRTAYEGPVSEELPKYLQFAMMHQSPQSLDITYAYWKHIGFSLRKKYSLDEIVIFLNACQLRTLKDWFSTYGGVTPEQQKEQMKIYEDFQLFVEEIEAYANPIIDDFSLKLIDEIFRLQHNEITGAGGGGLDTGNYKKKDNLIHLPT